MKTPFRMICLTDDPSGLTDGIEVQPLPEFRMDREDWHKGMWPKLAAFSPDVVAPGTPVIMMDVDVVILDDLTPLFDRVREQDGLHIIKDIPDTLPRIFPSLFKNPMLSNSSVVGFIAGTQDHLFEMFRDKTYPEVAKFRNDQNFIHYNAKNRQSWPEGWVLSFKKSLVYHFPVNFFRPIRRPKGYVVIFHGKPNPEDVVQAPFKRWGTAEKFGYFPVKWIRAYWDEFYRPTDK